MTHRRGRRPRLAAWLLAAMALAGCGGEYRIRPIQLEESAALTVAADPLLQQVGLARCTKAVTLNDVPARQLEVLPPFDDFCLGFAVSSAAIALPPAELRALIAHGLAHLELGHATRLAASSGTSRSRARGYTQARTHPDDEEAAADRRAAEWLRAAGGSPACAGLADVLARAAAEGERWSDWTAQHPLTPARANAARGLCTGRR